MALTRRTPISPQAHVLRLAVTPEDISACFSLMQLLRPHLQDAQELVTRWRRQQEQSYNLLVAWEEDCPVALAGFRYQENLLHGPHLYVDDLVTSDRARRNGYGTLLLDQLKLDATARGLPTLVLDAAIGNALGHRFYFRNGFLARGLHFWAQLGEEPHVSTQ
jgi:GNAT superfamily N-acetyltransferase